MRIIMFVFLLTISFFIFSCNSDNLVINSDREIMNVKDDDSCSDKETDQKNPLSDDSKRDEDVSDDQTEDEIISENKIEKVEGFVQKGPLRIGSSIDMQVLSNDLEPKNIKFKTKVQDETGFYSVNQKFKGQVVAVAAEGLYFNEVAGDFQKECEITISGGYIIIN